MEILDEIFGKSKGITKEDVEQNLLNKFKERVDLDFKQVENKSESNKWLEENKENVIIKPLVSFLNSASQKGLVIIGIKEENKLASKITGAKTAFIKNEEQLRGILTNHIVSIPKLNGSFPLLEIESTQIAQDEKIYFIEIKNHDNRLTYYSKETNKFYIRRGDESNPLTVDEAITIITNKRAAKVFINEKEQPKWDKNGKYIEYPLILINHGTKPSKNVLLVINMSYDEDNMNINIITTNNNKHLIFDEKNEKTYQISLHSAGTMPIYPGIRMSIGTLEFWPKDVNSHLDVQTIIYEEEGFTEQKIEIIKRKEKIEIHHQKSEYHSYLE